MTRLLWLFATVNNLS